MKQILPILLAVAVTGACTYPFTPELPSETERQLVVEGNILIGETSPVRLSVVHPLSDVTLYPSEDDGILTAGVSLADDAGTDYSVSGSYLTGFTADTRKAPLDRRYQLTVRVVWAEEPEPVEEVYQTPWLTVQPAPEIANVKVVAEDAFISVVASLNPADPDNRCYYWEYDENWEIHAQYEPLFRFNTEDGRYVSLEEEGWVNPNYYCWKSYSSREAGLFSSERQSVNRMVDQPVRSVSRTDRRLEVLYAFNLRVRGISPEGYRYYHTVAANSNLTGDLFSAMPDKVGGNVVCVDNLLRQAVGFVEAATTASRRIFTDSRYYRDIQPDQRLVPVLDEDYTLFDHYKNGYRPLYEGQDMTGASGMLWCPLRCIDCVVDGGTKNKPSYWPNDHK